MVDIGHPDAHSKPLGILQDCTRRLTGLPVLLVEKRHAYLAEKMKGPFLFGDKVSAADPYLYVMLRWADKFDVPLPEKLKAFKAQMEERAAVREALSAEGLA